MVPKAVKKAVIPVAGLGTRFLPATKAIPKEMLPIVDKPTILHIVEEAVEAGIEEIIFVTGRHKNCIEEFFDHNYEIEHTLERQGKTELLRTTKHISEMVRVLSVRQKNPLGLGHAILCAQPLVGNEPFAVLLGDEVMHRRPTSSVGNVTSQLKNIFLQKGQSVVAVMEVPLSDVKKYGIAQVQKTTINERVFQITGLIEKPQDVHGIKSRWALPGRYMFTSDIFKYLQEAKPGRNQEIQLTDSMIQLMTHHGLLALNFEADRYDVGDKFGFVVANIEFGLRHPEIGEELKNYILSIASQIKEGRTFS